MKIWRIIPDLEINWKPAPYPVVNENAVRAWAGLMFVLWMIALVVSITTKAPLLAVYIVPLIWLDLFIKVFIWPMYSPFMIIWEYLVRDKIPEYVWAKQKHFAWIIWLILALMVILILLVLWVCGPAMLICIVCLYFMWQEAVLWNCVWCNIYAKLRDKWHIKEEAFAPVCAGWACEIKK